MDDILTELFYLTEEAEEEVILPPHPKGYETINDIEEKLLNRLTAEDKELFIVFSDRMGLILADQKCQAFRKGVKLGVRLSKELGY